MQLILSHAETKSTDEWVVTFSGLIYFEGLAAGIPSIDELISRLDSGPVKDSVRGMRGNYIVCVENRKNGKWWISTDRAGMHPLFYSSEAASDSIRTVISNSTGLDANVPALHEFLAIGYYDDQNLPVKGVSRLSGDNLLTGDSTGCLNLVAKVIEPSIGVGDTAIIASYAHLATAMENRSMGLDLTAGWDSRLNLALLSGYPASIRPSLTAHSDHPDAIIGQQVANSLGLRYELSTPRSAENLDEDTVNSVLAASDGMYPDIETIQRKIDLAYKRIEGGAAVSIDGTGGELYKDFWWLQDFPFYGTKAPDFKRLIKTRFNIVEPRQFPLSEHSAKIAQKALGDVRYRLWRDSPSTNIEAYDFIYRKKMVSVPGQVLSAVFRTTGLPCYSPFLEYAHADFASNLSVRDRMFERFHRRLISRLLPQLDGIPTEKGMYANEALAVVVLRYSSNLIKRSASKIWQVRTGKTLINRRAPGNSSVYLTRILESKTWTSALELLVDNRLIDDPSSINTQSYSVVTRLLSVALILGDLQHTPIVGRQIPIETRELGHPSSSVSEG